VHRAHPWPHVVPRRGTGVDRGHRRPDADGLDVVFEVADAENLPYDEATYDVALSTFGVMFAPAQQRAADELLRVVRPGGRIGLASWTPEGFIGELFRVVGKHVPPAAGVASPLLWGSREQIATLFARASSVSHTTQYFAFRYRSPEHFVDVFRRYYGPTHKAFLALDQAGQAALEGDMLALLRKANQGGGPDAGLVIPGEYLESVVTR
jgi:SAM-dependent methyltransferase